MSKLRNGVDFVHWKLPGHIEDNICADGVHLGVDGGVQAMITTVFQNTMTRLWMEQGPETVEYFPIVTQGKSSDLFDEISSSRLFGRHMLSDNSYRTD